MTIRIASLKIKDEIDTGKNEVILKNITIIVGPNNSGKTEFLKDIETWSKSSFPSHLTKIVDDILNLNLPKSNTDILDFIENLEKDYSIDEIVYDEHTIMPDKISLSVPVKSYQYSDYSDVPKEFTLERGKIRQIMSDGLDVVKNSYTGPVADNTERGNDLDRLKAIINAYTIRVDAKTRFSLVQELNHGDLTGPPINYLSNLFNQDSIICKISKIMHDEFGYYFYLHNLSGGKIRIKLSKDEYTNYKVINNDTISFFKAATDIKAFSDGIQAFLGLLIAVFSLPHKIILIDDPEAFLHPPLSRNLGRYLSEMTVEKDSSLFVSTHSSDFLMGCLESTSKLTIIRLTYNGKKGSLTEIPSEDIKNIMQKPLLRSTNILIALFHKSAIITEGNMDRVFYSEINRKISEIDKNNWINDTVFINAVGKNVIHQIVSPLKQVKIPVVSIYDFDVLDNRKKKGNKNKEKLFMDILESINLDEQKKKSYLNLQNELKNHIETIHLEGQPDPYREKGLNYLSGDLKTKVDNMLSELQNDGMFINWYGTVESWFPECKNLNDTTWFENVLEKIDKTKLLPCTSNKDIWQFVRDIKKYIDTKTN